MTLDRLTKAELYLLLRQYQRNARNYDKKSEKIEAKHWWGKINEVTEAIKRKDK